MLSTGIVQSKLLLSVYYFFVSNGPAEFIVFLKSSFSISGKVFYCVFEIFFLY